MKKMFSYVKFDDELANSIVESMHTLAQKSMEGKDNTAEYEDLNKEVNEQFMKFCVESIPGTAYTGLDQIKNPMIYKNVFFTTTFDTVLAQAITPVVPTVVANGAENLFEVAQCGWGDNISYTVDSNELYIVNSLAEGIEKGAQQTISNAEYTVSAHRESVSVYADWYLVAASKLDWGKMIAKIGASFAAFVQGKVAKALASLITNAANHGIAGYLANGMTDQNWLTVSRNVRLANGGADVYALGTSIALADVLPNGAGASSFIYGEDSLLVKKGFLPAYKNVPLVEMGNAIVPNTINGTPAVVMPDDIIYMIPMGGYKPVKVLIEGNTVSVERDPLFQADHCYGFTVDVRLGVDVVVGSKIGAIQLA